MIEIREQIEIVLEKIRPHLRQDGGDIEFVRWEAESSVAEFRFLGNCAICPLKMMTLRAGIERRLIHHIPQIRRIEAVV